MLNLLPSFFALSLPALFVTSVRAHGYVQDVVVGSTHYTGYLPYSDPYYNPPPQRIIRKIPGNGMSFSFITRALAMKLRVLDLNRVILFLWDVSRPRYGLDLDRVRHCRVWYLNEVVWVMG